MKREKKAHAHMTFNAQVTFCHYRVAAMTAHNSLPQNQTTNIIIVAGNDETLQNILSIIQKPANSNGLTNIAKHVVSIAEDYICEWHHEFVFSSSLNRRKTKQQRRLSIAKLIWLVWSAKTSALDIISKSFPVDHVNPSFIEMPPKIW